MFAHLSFSHIFNIFLQTNRLIDFDWKSHIQNGREFSWSSMTFLPNFLEQMCPGSEVVFSSELLWPKIPLPLKKVEENLEDFFRLIKGNNAAVTNNGAVASITKCFTTSWKQSQQLQRATANKSSTPICLGKVPRSKQAFIMCFITTSRWSNVSSKYI